MRDMGGDQQPYLGKRHVDVGGDGQVQTLQVPQRVLKLPQLRGPVRPHLPGTRQHSQKCVMYP